MNLLLLSILAFSLVVLLVLFLRLNLIVSTSLLAISFLLLNKFLNLSIIWLVIFLAIAIPFNISFIRRMLLTDRIFALYKKIMPQMSQTEKEALEAGTVWFDRELFTGMPDYKKLLNHPKPKLTEEEEAFINGPVEELCSMLDDWKITNDEKDLPLEVWDFIKKNKFFAMIIPKEYGGLALSTLAHSEVVSKIAGRSITAAVTVMVPNSLGPADLLHRYGTTEQKDKYLPRLSTGEEIPCFALTGPSAGSDAASMPDVGIVSRGTFEGKEDVLGIRLNWEKRYITLGPVATLLGLAFKLKDPDGLMGDTKDYGITLALIPTDLEGVTIGERHLPLNTTFMVGPNYGKDVFIPLDYIIGGIDYAGKGWRMLMDCLSEGRSVSLPALSGGSSKMATRVVTAYSTIRKQFKMPIAKFEGIEEVLAETIAFTYLIDSARLLTATIVDAGEQPSVISAIAKYHLTELGRKNINNTMDILGGSAICLGPKNLVARIYQSMPISITVEGANILTRNMIIFGQGAIRCHPYIFKEMEAAEKNDGTSFDKAITGHIGFTVSNAVRGTLLGLTCSRLTCGAGDRKVRKYFRHITRLSSAFAFTSDVTMAMYGASLKRKERISARLGDVLSHLYLASSVLKNYNDTDKEDKERMLPYVEYCLQYSLHEAERSFFELFENYSIKAIGKILRLMLFPFGSTYKKPSDKLAHIICKNTIKDTEARELLTKGVFIGDDESEPLRQMEDTFVMVKKEEEIERKIKEAVKQNIIKKDETENMIKEAIHKAVITKEDSMFLEKTAKARYEVISVDSFTEEEMTN